MGGMVSCRYTYHPRLGVVQTFVLKIFDSGPWGAHLLPVAARWLLETGGHPRPSEVMRTKLLKQLGARAR